MTSLRDITKSFILYKRLHESPSLFKQYHHFFKDLIIYTFHLFFFYFISYLYIHICASAIFSVITHAFLSRVVFAKTLLVFQLNCLLIAPFFYISTYTLSILGT